MKLLTLSEKLSLKQFPLLTICSSVWLLCACGGGSSGASPSEQAEATLQPVSFVSTGDNRDPNDLRELTYVPDSTGNLVPVTTLALATTTSTAAPSTGTEEIISGAFASVKVENTSGASQSNLPVTFGQVFAQGEIFPANMMTGKLSDGTVVPLQLDVKATHGDGSVRHGIISAVVPKLTAGQIQKIGLTKSVSNSATKTATGPAELLNGGFTSSVNLNIGGQIYSASADALLKSGKYTTWLAGPVVNEWLVSAPFKTAQGVEHPHLAARFAIRSFAGQNKARVDVIIENNWAYATAPQNFTYDVQVAVGGQPVYSKAALTHYHHARWRKTFWWGGEPPVHIRHDVPYLIASKAVPNYDQTVTIPSAALTTIKNQFVGAVTEPMGNGLATPYMPQTGGRPDIGLLPGWAATYLLSMDRTALAATLGTGNLGGSWSAHYRDRNTDRPISLVDYPYLTVLGKQGDTYNPVSKKYEAFPACGGVCTNPNQVDSSHQPSLAYLPYLVTGDNYYLEELQFWAMYNLFQYPAAYREAGKGLVKPEQLRGQAWSLRTLADAAFITPDADPLRKQFEALLSSNLDWYNATYTNNPAPDNVLGIITNGYSLVYENGRGTGPWQDDFFTAAIGHIAELGFTKAKPLLAWKAKFPVSRMVGPGYCWIQGSIYALLVRDSATTPIYPTIKQAYQASVPGVFAQLACASSAMALNLGLKVGEMVGYADSTSGSVAIMQAALAYSVDAGVPDGAAAWKVFMGRTVKPNYGTGPQFAILPR